MPKFANIHINNAIIQILVNISKLFFEKAYLVTMSYSLKLVDRTNSWNK